MNLDKSVFADDLLHLPGIRLDELWVLVIVHAMVSHGHAASYSVGIAKAIVAAWLELENDSAR